MSGNVTPTTGVVASGDAGIDGILTNTQWSGGSIFYSFPTTNASYSYFSNFDWPANMFGLNSDQQDAVHFALNADIGPNAADGFSVEGFTNLTITQDTSPDSGDTIRIANTTSTTLGTAAVSDFPGNSETFEADDNGDVWFGPYQSGIYLTPEAGNFAWHTHLHELGHALGLSHGHSTFQLGVKLPSALDAMEYSVMTYRSYVNDPLVGGYSNETFGYAQSYMMQDIAALQYLYGADFTTNSGNTTYKWNPGSGDTLVNGAIAIDAGANRIFATIWDGGGIDTYDLSSYTTALQIDLRPGEASLFSTVQQANLGDGNFAKGNIYNALQFQGDVRSLIENATGGTSNDDIEGNAAANVLIGGLGNDTLTGNAGNDTLLGQGGNDRILGGANNDVLNGDAGNDTIRGGTNEDLLRGGTQEDFLFGDSGNDTLLGQAGFDWLEGGTGHDLLNGGAQADNLFGGTGNDTMLGGDGFDRLFGQDGNDLGYGGATFDSLYGQVGNDTLFGQGGNDGILGGIGNDVLDGGADNDTLTGGAGFDTLVGSIGNDRLTGAYNADIFVFADFGGGFGQDTITDFDAFNPFEKIDLARVGAITSYADLTNPGSPHMTQVGANVVINDFSGNTITLLNVNIGNLDSTDFIF